MDFDGLTAEISALEKILRESGAGWSSEEALNAIKKLAFIIRRDCGGESYILDRVGTIESIADVLYNPRKANGVSDSVKQTMLIACQNILDHVMYLERAAKQRRNESP